MFLALSAVCVDFFVNARPLSPSPASHILSSILTEGLALYSWPVVHVPRPSAASIPLTDYNQCLIIHTKVQLNRRIKQNASLPHWFERNGVFEWERLQSSRCLAYLNYSPPPRPPVPPSTPLLAYPSQRQRVDWSRKLCVCFHSSSHKVRAAERAQAGISKGAGRPPPPPHGTTLGGELVTDPPIHGFILVQQAGKGLSPLL